MCQPEPSVLFPASDSLKCIVLSVPNLLARADRVCLDPCLYFSVFLSCTQADCNTRGHIADTRVFGKERKLIISIVHLVLSRLDALYKKNKKQWHFHVSCRGTHDNPVISVAFCFQKL